MYVYTDCIDADPRNVWELHNIVKEGEVEGREDEHYVMTLERAMAAYLWSCLVRNPIIIVAVIAIIITVFVVAVVVPKKEKKDVRFAVIMLQKSLASVSE